MPLLKRLFAVLLATMPGAAGSLAADYDCPRATLIVPYTAGGAADVAARLLADRFEVLMKRSFVIENRPGPQAISGPPPSSTPRRTAARCWSMPR